MREVFDFLNKNGLPKLTEFYQHKVDQKTFASLRTRAEAFEFNGRSMDCELLPDLTFDLGTMRLNSQLFLSVIDVKKSKGLIDLVSRKLGYAATADNTGACMVVQRTFAYQLSKKIGKPAWRYEDFLVVVRMDGKRLLSQHVVTPTRIRSLVAPRIGGRKEGDVTKWFNSAIPGDAQLIRGLNDSTIVWNGKKWGTAEFVPEGNLMIGGRQIGVGQIGKFKETDLGRPFRVALGSPFGEFEDEGQGFVIPGPTPEPGRPGPRDWLMRTDQDIHQTVGGGGYGGGAGGSSGVETGSTYSGSGACAAQYTTVDACYGCCDTQGSQILAAGIATTTAITTAAGAATLPGGPLAIVAVLVVAVIGISGTLIIAWVASDACKSACRNTLASTGGGGAITDAEGNYIT